MTSSLKVIRKHRPIVILSEQSTGILNHKHLKFFLRIIKCLRELKYYVFGVRGEPSSLCGSTAKACVHCLHQSWPLQTTFHISKTAGVHEGKSDMGKVDGSAQGSMSVAQTHSQTGKHLQGIVEGFQVCEPKRSSSCNRCGVQFTFPDNGNRCASNPYSNQGFTRWLLCLHNIIQARNACPCDDPRL